MEEAGKAVTPDEVREDASYINDEYLTMACYMVAQQYICDDYASFLTQEGFAERTTYLLRQHCPMAYSYFFTQIGLEILPYGTLMIIVNTVRQHKPTFMFGLI